MTHGADAQDAQYNQYKHCGVFAPCSSSATCVPKQVPIKRVYDKTTPFPLLTYAHMDSRVPAGSDISAIAPLADGFVNSSVT